MALNLNHLAGLYSDQGRSSGTEPLYQQALLCAEDRPICIDLFSGYGVSTTPRAGTDATRGAFTSPRPIHYRYARCVTVREMARLHSFPDWFRLHETKWHGARQIGNSVPPPLARAIAFEIARAMDYCPVVPKGILPVADKSLLTMTVPEAARYWGIENPISPRGSKPGDGVAFESCRPVDQGDCAVQDRQLVVLSS